MKIVEKTLKLKLENVYGGDGYTYIDQIEEVKLNRSKKRVTVRKDIGIPIETIREERKSEQIDVEVNTFRRDNDGKPVLRLGGSHGKLWGALREAGHLMYQVGEMNSKAEVDRILKMIRMEPDMVRLVTDGQKMKREILPQIMNTIGNSQVQMHYDVIPECTTKITIKYPDVFQEKVEKMLEYLQTMNCLNKRRASITILN